MHSVPQKGHGLFLLRWHHKNRLCPEARGKAQTSRRSVFGDSWRGVCLLGKAHSENQWQTAFHYEWQLQGVPQAGLVLAKVKTLLVLEAWTYGGTCHSEGDCQKPRPRRPSPLLLQRLLGWLSPPWTPVVTLCWDFVRLFTSLRIFNSRV